MARQGKHPRDEVPDPAELALVRKAFISNLSNCVIWRDDRTRRRVEAEGLDDTGLTSAAVLKMTIKYVKGGGKVYQIQEKRAEYRSRHRYWYKILLEVDGVEKLLFVETVLHDNDPEFPVVLLVNAHF